MYQSVQLLSCVRLFATPWTAARQASLSITNSRSSLKLMSIESVMPSNRFTLCSPLPSCLQSFPASGSFPMSQFFASHGQSIGVSTSASVLPMNIQDWLPLELTWISLLSNGLSGVFSNTTVQKHLWCSAFFIVQLSHPYMTTGKTIALTRQNFVGKVTSLLFNMPSRLVITFLPRSKVSFNFMAAVTICSDSGAPRHKVCHCFPSYLPWSEDAMILVFWMLSFKPTFSLCLFTFIKRL